MFDHVVFGVSDYAASKEFFIKALTPLGVTEVSEGPLGVELCRPDNSASLCIRRQPEARPSHLHLAFTADSHHQVDAFYRAALEAADQLTVRAAGVQGGLCEEPEVSVNTLE